MSAAINGNAKENNRTRTYGAIFINYHPYYYRGVANLNLGRYEQAISDFEKTSGPGELDLGSISDLIGRAKSRLEAASTPAPAPAPVPVPQPVRPAPAPVPQPAAPVPQPATPAVPSIDPGLRARAASALNAAKARLAAAQRRKATASPQYGQALTALTDANTRNATARTNEDLNSVIAVAENAGLLADSAVAAGAPAAAPPVLTPVPRPAAATDAVLADADHRLQIRNALENYFAGEFETATRNFQDLSVKMPTNGWIWAFLGASQYSVYAFEADETFKAAALDSFKKAKKLKSWKGGLPDKYFSKRIRRVFDTVG
jgi:tetratricopeptide (TPR) repeat protein